MRTTASHLPARRSRPARRSIPLGLVLSAAALLVPTLARAETITGTFRYADKNPATNAVAMQPIASATVEIHRFRPRALGIWAWGHDATTTTDVNGRLSLSMDFVAPGVIYGVKVFASNRAAIVWPNDVVHTVPFHREPGQPDGAIINRVATSEASVLDFSYDFREEWSAQHFNIAETIRRGFAFVQARRDPRETDFLPSAAVQPTSVTNSWYNLPFDTLVITSGDVFSDFLILHEYGHFVEQHIGAFFPLPTSHDGCQANLVGFDATVPAHAWMEGFADWFAHAVGLDPLGNGLTGFGLVGGTFSPGTLETPPPCSVLPDGDRIELRVAGALWDVVDVESDVTSGVEAHDVLGRASAQVVQILDRELDPPDGPVRPAPDITAFRAAWIRRGLPACELGRIYEGLSIPFRENFQPIANAGRDIVIHKIGPVRLNGSRSCDPELRPLTFLWRQIAGPRVLLTNPRSPTPMFRRPPPPARLAFRLTVSDGARIARDVVRVTIVG